MNEIFAAEMNTSIGPLVLAASEQGLCHIHFGGLDESLGALLGYGGGLPIKVALLELEQKEWSLV